MRFHELYVAGEGVVFVETDNDGQLQGTLQWVRKEDAPHYRQGLWQRMYDEMRAQIPENSADYVEWLADHHGVVEAINWAQQRITALEKDVAGLRSLNRDLFGDGGGIRP